MNDNKKKNKKKGFTLIELLIIVLIIGVLAGIALPLYLRAVEKSRTSEPLQTLSTIANAQQRYKLHDNTYATEAEKLDVTLKDNSTGTDASGSTFDSEFFDYTLGEDFAQAARKDGDYTLGIDYDTHTLYCGGSDTSMCERLGLEVRNISNNSNSESWSPCNGAYASLVGYEPASCQMKSDGSGNTIFQTENGYCYEGFGCYRDVTTQKYVQNNPSETIYCNYYTPNGGEEVLNTNCTKTVYMDGFSYQYEANERTPDSDYPEYPRYITDNNGCQLVGGTNSNNTVCYVSNTMINMFNSNCSNITSAGIYELCS